MIKHFPRQLFTLFFVILFSNYKYAQTSGRTTLVEGHHLIGVKANYTSLPLNYEYESSSSFQNVPGFNVHYQEGDIIMKNIMGNAALAIDWWVFFGEPTENYGFIWKAKDYYELVISEPKYGGSVVTKTVSKSSLTKYPDLLMRYEALKPTEIAFEIEWSFGVTDSDVFDQTGYPFATYYNTGNKFKTVVSSASILTEPSGVKPFAVPSIRPGKGEAFLGLPTNFPKDKVKELMQLFAKTKSLYIAQVNITKIKWPIAEMRNIAELYEKYEKGEVDPSPLQIINEELKKTQNITTYNNEDFWSDIYENEIKTLEIFYDNEYNKVGIKTNNKITYQRERTAFMVELIKIPQTRNYFLDVSSNGNIPFTNRLIKIIDNFGNKKILDEIPNIFDYRVLEDGNLYLYKKLNSFTKVKFGQFNNLYTDSTGRLKSFLVQKGYLLGEFTTNRNQLEKTINDLLFENTNNYLKDSNKWWGVGEFMEYKLNQNLEVIGKRIVYFAYYQ